MHEQEQNIEEYESSDPVQSEDRMTILECYEEILQQFLAANGVVTLDHSSLFTWFAPADFFLFPRFKSALKGKRFTDITNIQSYVTAELKVIPK
ncbi:hypothetical protein TNCV_1338811 [Trichonephila clavipes]|nr:hypothetical protein TNCV_1338811 [Trichonephila clavipes]